MSSWQLIGHSIVPLVISVVVARAAEMSTAQLVAFAFYTFWIFLIGGMAAEYSAKK